MYLIRHVASLVQLTLVMLSPYISVILASQIDDITQHVTKVSAMIESLIDLHVTYSDEFNVSRYVASKSKRPPISAPLFVSCRAMHQFAL